jgi:hypothetical protein
MLDKLDPLGYLGILLVLTGIGVVAWKAPVVAAGIAAVLLGVGLVAKSAVQSVMGMFGM